MDHDGFFIVGRKKRIIKLHGNRINLDVIEHRLSENFPNDDFACIGNDNMIHTRLYQQWRGFYHMYLLSKIAKIQKIKITNFSSNSFLDCFDRPK